MFFPPPHRPHLSLLARAQGLIQWSLDWPMRWKRWQLSKQQMQLEWQMSPLYWRVRYWWRVSHRHKGEKHWQKRRSFGKRYQRLVSGQTLRKIAVPSLACALVLLFLLALPESLVMWLEQEGAQSKSLPSWWSALPSWLSTILVKIASSKTALGIDAGTYITFVSTVTQLIGLVLSLYIATVSWVISTSYSRAPSDVRQRLVDDTLGNLYVRLLAVSSGLGVLLLARHTLGYSPLALHLVVFAFLGIVSLVSFYKLGERLLDFFNPLHLASSLAAEVLDCVRFSCSAPNSSTAKFFSKTGSVPNNDVDNGRAQVGRRETEQLLDTLGSVVGIATTVDHAHGANLQKLGYLLIRTQLRYLPLKINFPAQSLWFSSDVFGSVQRHKDWMFPDYFERNTALSTGTGLIPENVPDAWWLDNHLNRLLGQVLDSMGQHSAAYHAAHLNNLVIQSIGAMATAGMQDEALNLIKTVDVVIDKQIQRIPLESTNRVAAPGESNDQTRATAALLELHSLSFTRLILGVSKFGEAVSDDWVRDYLGGIIWRNESTLSRSLNARPMLQVLRELREPLVAELDIEGRLVTPSWFIESHVARAYALQWEKSWETIIADWEKRCLDRIPSLINEGRILFAAVLLERALETTDKLEFHLGLAHDKQEEWRKLLHAKTVKWPQTPWEKLQERVKSRKNELHLQYATLIKPLLSIQIEPEGTSQTLPDFAGHAYQIAANQLVGYLQEGDEKLFAKLFPLYLEATWPLIARTEERYKSHSNSLMFSSEVVFGLLSVSGLALVYAELNSKRFDRVVKAEWDNQFDPAKSGKWLLRYIVQFVEAREVGAVNSVSIHRQAWETALQQELEKRGFLGRNYGPHHGSLPMSPPSGPLVGHLTGSGYMIRASPEDIFLGIYLANRSEATGREWPSDIEEWKNLNAPPSPTPSLTPPPSQVFKFVEPDEQ